MRMWLWMAMVGVWAWQPVMACEAHHGAEAEEGLQGPSKQAIVAAAKQYQTQVKDGVALPWALLLEVAFKEERAPLPEGEALDAMVGKGTAECTAEMAAAMPTRRVTQAAPEIEAVNGSGQVVRGYVYGGKGASRHFVLGPYPESCAGCPEFPLASGVEVMAPLPIMVKEGPMSVKGHFEIIRDVKEFGYTYRLIGAEVVEKKR